MKIAVACMGTQVAGHFGHCENFRIYEAENGQIQKEESVANPGHRPGFLPNFLGDMGVEVILAGGMGASASGIFQSRNIEVVTGVEGDARTSVERWLRGELHSTGAICQEHEHHHGHDHHGHHGHTCGEH